jgi:hypothetical protein
MPDDEAVDYPALRARFPWVGLADEQDMPAASHVREVMARSRVDREVIDAIDAVRHTA